MCDFKIGDVLEVTGDWVNSLTVCDFKMGDEISERVC